MLEEDDSASKLSVDGCVFFVLRPKHDAQDGGGEAPSVVHAGETCQSNQVIRTLTPCNETVTGELTLNDQAVTRAWHAHNTVPGGGPCFSDEHGAVSRAVRLLVVCHFEGVETRLIFS